MLETKNLKSWKGEIIIKSSFKQNDATMLGIFKSLSFAFVIKIIGAGLGFAFNIVLARLLGADGAGVYFLALSITTIASIISKVGLDNTVLRFIAAGASEEKWDEVKGIYSKSILIIVPLSLIITIAVFLLANPLSSIIFNKPELEAPLRWMSLSILPLSLLSIHAEMLKGLSEITASLSLQSIFLPLLNIIVLVILASELGNLSASLSFLVAAIITSIIGVWLWHKKSSVLHTAIGIFKWRELFKSCLPNYSVSLLHKAILPWLPLLLLGYWSTTEDISFYSTAVRTAMLVSFILLALNSVLAPKFAALYRKNNIKELRLITKKATWLTIFVALPFVLPMIFFPKFIMSAFGSDFKQAANLLVILSIGQFINVVFGPVGYLLVMTGNEALQKNSVLISAAILFILLVTLIPLYGSFGAAIATVVSGTMFNLVSYLYVKHRLGFSTFL